MDGGRPGRQRDATATSDPAAEEELKRTRLKLVGLSFQIGSTFVGAFALFMGGGFFLDRWLGTSPLFLMVGMLLAFVAIGYSLYEIATIGYKPRAAKSAAEKPTAVAPPPPPDPWDDDPWAKDDWDKDDWKRDDDWPAQRRDGGPQGKER